MKVTHYVPVEFPPVKKTVNHRRKQGVTLHGEPQPLYTIETYMSACLMTTPVAPAPHITITTSLPKHIMVLPWQST